MTTPLIDAEDSNLAWQNSNKRIQDIRSENRVQDTVSVPAGDLGYETFYTTVNNIRQSSATATAGQIAADNTRRAKLEAEAAAAREKARQAAMEDAMKRYKDIASQPGFGQPDWSKFTLTEPNFGAYPGTGFAPGQGPGQGYDGSDAAVADLMRAAGFPEHAIGMGLAIVWAESSNRANATHKNSDSHGSTDLGLWQINDYWQRDKLAGKNAMDPYVSTLIAKQIYDEWGGWGAWTTYNRGLRAKSVPAPRATQPVAIPMGNVTIPSYAAPTGGSTGLRNTIISQASRWFGFPYVWGGESPGEGGFDCSGLVYRAYKDAGINISRTTANAYSLGQGGINGQRTTLNNLRPGDLVAWSHNRSGMPGDFVGHIAIYAGNGEIIEARGSGIPVRRVKISNYDWLIGIHVSLPGD